LVQVRRRTTSTLLRDAQEVRESEEISSSPGVSFDDGPNRGAHGPPVEFPGGRPDGPVEVADRVAVPVPAPTPVPGFVSPLLALVAALSILEGYIWLNVIAVDRWRPSTVAFAVVTCGVAVLVVWPLRGGRRVAITSVVVTSVILVVMTVLAVVIGGPVVARLAGVSDLLFAVSALATVAAIEHPARRTS